MSMVKPMLRNMLTKLIGGALLPPGSFLYDWLDVGSNQYLDVGGGNYLRVG